MPIGELDIQVVVSASEAQRGLKQTSQAIEGLGNTAAKSFGKADREAAKFEKSAARMAAAQKRIASQQRAVTTNLTSQFQDIAVSAASGMNVMTVALQQGTQVASIFASSGASIATVGAAFASLLSPVSLLSIGLTAAGAGLINWAVNAGKAEQVDLEPSLKRTDEALKKLAEHWPQVNTELEKYGIVAEQIARGEAFLSQTDAAGKLATKLDELEREWVGFQLPDWWSRPENAPILDAFDQFIAKVAKGEASADDFRNTIDSMQGLPGITSDMIGMGQAMADFAEDTINARGGANELSAALLQFGAGAARGKPDIIGLTDALAKIAATNSDKALARVAAELLATLGPARTLAEQSGQLATALDTVTESTNRLSIATRNARAGVASAASTFAAWSGAVQSSKDVVDPTAVAYRNLLETKTAGLQAAKTVEQVRAVVEWYDKAVAAQQALDAAAAAGGGGGSALDAQATKLAAWAEQMQLALDPTLKLRQEQELLNQAVAAGLIPMSEQAKAQALINEKYGEASSKITDYQKVFEQWSSSVASSLSSAIVNGQDLGEVFKNLAAQLAEMVLQALVLKPLMENIGKAFGLSASVPVGGSVPQAGSLRSLPAPGMLSARNAMVGSGNGVVNNSLNGGVNIVFSSDGSSSASSKGDDQRMQKFGERVRDVVQREMVNQSRPGGLLWGSSR